MFFKEIEDEHWPHSMLDMLHFGTIVSLRVNIKGNWSDLFSCILTIKKGKKGGKPNINKGY